MRMVGLRRKCSRCERRRKVAAWWDDSGKVFCRGCSLTPDIAFTYSIRRFQAQMTVRV